MADTFSYDSAEEDWDLNALYHINLQLESYLKMLPGGGTDMTLSELQEMATRQQHQIESQQQILVAKEQRLKYLKQQEQKQQQLASENDKLRKLRDKVETQEMKLKKLRSLRGQVEQQKASNGNLNYELESIKSLFNEKEKELAMAVAKVEEMTRQLEDIRSGRVKTNTNNQSPAAMAELEKLKKELMIRNKLNEQQNSKMGANRELLMKRKDEVARMDNRILELQMRLKKKRADAEVALRNKQQPVNNNTQNLNNKVMNRPIANVAPVESNVETKAGFGKNDPKYQSLPPNSKFLHPDKQNTNREANNNKVDFVRYEADKSDEFSVPLVVTVDNSNKNHTNNVPSPKSGGQTVHVPHPGQQKPSVPDNHQTNARFGHNIVPPRSGMTHFTPRPFGSTYSTSVVPDRGSGGVPHDQPHFDLQEEVRQAGSGQSSPGSVESLQNGTGKVVPPYPGRDHSHNKPQTVDTTQHLKGQGKESNHKGKLKDPPNKGPPVPVRSTNGSNNSSPTTPPTTLSLNTSTHPNTANNTGESDPEQSGISVSKGIQKFSGLIAQNQGENPRQQQGASTNSGGFSNLNHASALGAVRSAPTYRYASKSVIANTYLGKLDNEALEKYQKSVLSLHANLNKKSETQADSVKQVKPSEKSALHEEEKDSLSPLSSVSSPASSASTVSPVSPSQQQNYPFDFPVSPPHADVASDKVSYKPNTPKNIRRRHSDSDNEEVGKALHKYNINMNSNKNVPSQENQMRVLDHAGNGAVEIQATTFSDHIPETVLLDSKGNIVEVGEGPGKDVSKVNNNINSNKTEVTSEKSPEVPIVVTSKGVKLKSNIRRKDRKHNNRVSFDPLALLLDASLEGEVDLVRRCAHQVENVSASNDEGITALHNAICAGHYDIVTFLVEFGCDVNSPDSDGWTPLHCAASCNNLPMVKFLVEHGACIFATTISDQETAAEKCEEDEDGYDGCSEYLYSIQEKMGIINGGAVYAVFDYAKQRTDELALNMGNKFIVLKKGDDVEKDWWWAKCDEKHGYIPKNLLGLTPRVIPQEQLNGEV